MKENKLTTFSLVYFLSRSLFLGLGTSQIFKLAGSDTWISVILGTMIGLMFIYIICKFRERKGNKKLNDCLSNTKLGLITRIFIIILAIFLIISANLIIEVFAVSFFLYYTPGWFVILPLLVILFYFTLKGMKIVNRVSTALLPIGICLFLFAALSLVYLVKIPNFLPVLTVKTSKILLSSFIFAILSSVPNFFLIDHAISTKSHIISYLFAGFSMFVVVVISTGVLGPNLISLYRYPEYMILKKINIFNFIENIENLIAYLWYFDIFIFLGVITTFMKNLLPIKFNKIFLATILLSVFIFCGLFLFNNYKSALIVYYSAPYIIISLFIIIILLLLKVIKKRKNI